MEAVTAVGRQARDTQLVRAGALLLCAGLLDLVANTLRLATTLDIGGVKPANILASVLDVVSQLPALAAFAFVAWAFLVQGEARYRRLRQAFLLAATAQGINFVAGVLAFAALDSSALGDFKVAWLSDSLSALVLSVAFLIASAGFLPGRTTAQRDRMLSWAAVAAGFGCLLAALSVLEFGRADSFYSSHSDFVHGHVLEGLGLAGAAYAIWFGATAFRRPGLRERRLFIAAATLAASLVVLALGQDLVATGTVSFGYTGTDAAANWVSTAMTLLLAAAAGCASLGFRRATEQP
ncbi:MAG: hypothetical protein ACTHN3_04720 [Solirubrobacterales bacterium]